MNGKGKALPRKFLMVERIDGRYDIMCEIGARTYTAEVPENVGRGFLEKVYEAYLTLVAQRGVITPRIKKRRTNGEYL